MIYLLHGEDQAASYARLKELIATLPKVPRVSLAKENTKDDLYMALMGTSILGNENIVIAQNFIKDKKITAKDDAFKNLPTEKTLVLWEQAQLTAAQIKGFASFTTVESFKPEPVIFQFLDSLSPNSKLSYALLSKLGESETSIIWHLANRVLLLTLAKIGVSYELAGKISGRPIAPWQWQKIERQAIYFKEKDLKDFLNGCLKADFMLKSGKSNLDQNTLVSFLLLKYLSAPKMLQ